MASAERAGDTFLKALVAVKQFIEMTLRKLARLPMVRSALLHGQAL